MTLPEFLLARIADDEQWASIAADAHVPGFTFVATSTNPSVTSPARVLAECEAKRRIVEEEHNDGADGDYVAPFCWTCSDDENLVDLPCPTLRLLALPYADHPDYREEWRP